MLKKFGTIGNRSIRRAKNDVIVFVREPRDKYLRNKIGDLPGRKIHYTNDHSIDQLVGGIMAGYLRARLFDADFA